MIAYQDYRFVARLDWIDLRVSLVRPTQSRHLRAALQAFPWGAASHVDSAAGAAHNTDTVWTIRIQDPRSVHSVRRDLEELQQAYPFLAAPEVTGLEVAFDAYAEGAHADLVAMAEHMLRGLADPPSGNRRIAGPKGTRGLVESARESRHRNRQALTAGMTLHIGSQGDDRSVRVYVKNNLDGQHARLENTFMGTAVPFKRLDEWQHFDFRRLAQYFRWRRTTVMSRVPAVWLNYPPTLADPPTAHARAQHKRIHRVGTVADRELSDEARRALGKLTTQQRQRR